MSEITDALIACRPLDKGGMVHNVLHPDYGATGDGETDDYDALVLAEAALGTLVFPAGTYVVSTDLTLDSHMRFEEGAMLSPESGITITITGSIEAGPYQIFGGLGTVTLDSEWYPGITAKWWGATSEVQTLADDATPSVKGGRYFVTGGTTTITDFDDGIVGQRIEILSAHSITITDNANIILNGSGDFAMADTDTLTLVMLSDGVWSEFGRSDNS